MTMEQVLYSQLVMLSQKDLNINEANKNKNKDKLKFQGHSARSQHQSDLDFYLIEEKFSTQGPDFYKRIYQRHDETRDTNIFKIFQVPIGNAKNVEEIKFHIDPPMLKYRQNSSKSCCFSSLVSAFEIINQTKAANDKSMRIG